VDTNHIATLLRPFVTLDEEHLAQTLIYVNLILKWNARMNLTAVRAPDQIVTRHFGESFFAARQLLAPGQSTSVTDLGSGAGFPGLPLAMLAPQAQMTLIESSNKKTAFLNEVIRALSLGNVTVFNGRGEDYPGRANLVTMRAVEKFEAAVALAAGMLEPKGRLALMIGRGQAERAREFGPGLVWSDPVEVPGGHSRVLLIGQKSSHRIIGSSDHRVI
jgi:16S rRNA (guanine527-N7)-methyltransferase